MTDFIETIKNNPNTPKGMELFVDEDSNESCRT